MPSSSATIWANVVSWPWPCVFTPSLRIALPVGCTRSSAESIIFSPRMSYFFDGPAPTASVKCAMPMPMSRPSFACFGLLGAQLLVADLVERLAQRGRVVARVVDEAGRRRRTGTARAG